MSKKKWCGLLAILMAVSIVFTSGALRPVNVYAETIADLQEQSEEHQKKLEEINQQIEEAEANKADALEQKNLLDQQADVLRSQISNAQQQIDALEAELADNQQKEESQYDLFCRQVRDEEERGTASFWSVIFKATSFSDLLGRIDFINEVAEHDQSVINDLRQLRQQMQADRQALEEQRSQLESRQTELDSQLEAATQLIAKYNETADGLNDLAAQEKAAADELDAQIQARREEENRNNGGDNSGGGGGGGGAIIVVAGAAAVGLVGYGIYNYVAERQLQALLPEGVASPENRAQTALLLWNTAGRPEPAAQPAFPDVADPDTAKAAQWCVEQGLMKRRLNGKFAPGSSIPAYQVLNAYRKLAGG